MSYDSEVAADSPRIYYKTDEASGTIADSSGNGLNGTLPGGSPTYAQTGPSGAADAMNWPDSSGGTEYYLIKSVSNTPSAAPMTLECWFYYGGSAPSNPTPLVAMCFGYGNNSQRPVEMYIGTDGKLKGLTGSGTSSGNSTVISSGSVLSTGWHHAVLAVATGAWKLRLDKVDVATSSTTVSFTTTASFLVHGGGSAADGTGGDLRNGAAVKISKPALYTTKLSDARIDAHYDAMIPQGALTASVPHPVALALTGTYRDVGSFAVVLPKPTLALAGDYTPPATPTGAFDLMLPVPVVALSGEYREAGALAATLPKPVVALAGAYTAPPSGSLALTLPVPALALTGDYTLPSHPVGDLYAVLPMPRLALVGTYIGPELTDVSNDFDGLDMGGYGVVTITVPASTPTTTAPPVVNKAIPLPMPVLVKGRET